MQAHHSRKSSEGGWRFANNLRTTASTMNYSKHVYLLTRAKGGWRFATLAVTRQECQRTKTSQEIFVPSALQGGGRVALRITRNLHGRRNNAKVNCLRHTHCLHITITSEASPSKTNQSYVNNYNSRHYIRGLFLENNAVRLVYEFADHTTYNLFGSLSKKHLKVESCNRRWGKVSQNPLR